MSPDIGRRPTGRVAPPKAIDLVHLNRSSEAVHISGPTLSFEAVDAAVGVDAAVTGDACER